MRQPERTAVPSRRLLVIAYHFPPDMAVGAVRPAKFAKYLLRLGWNPYVVTVREQYAPVQDATRLGDVAGIPISRTAVWPTVLDLAVKLKPPRRRRPEARIPTPDEGRSSAAETFLARIKRYANSIFELPDKQIGWLIPAVFDAYRLIRREWIELVMTSSPPRTTALVGLVLSYIAPIRLVTDLRDPWFIPYARDSWFSSLGYIAAGRSALADRIEHWLERKIVQRSARVIVTNDRLAKALRDAYPTLPADRICTIPNGYDVDDLPGPQSERRARAFTIAYVGTFYLHRSPRSVFQALSELMLEGKLSSDDMVVDLIGDVRSTVDGSVEHLIASSGLTCCVRIVPSVSYKESLQRMAGSDLLLLFAPNQYCSIPAKAFEYLATRKPILCLAQDGATADLVRAADAGFVVNPEDVGGIKTAIVSAFDAFRRGHPRTTASDVSIYERSALSAQLSRVLAQIHMDTPLRSDGTYAAEVTPAD